MPFEIRKNIYVRGNAKHQIIALDDQMEAVITRTNTKRTVTMKQNIIKYRHNIMSLHSIEAFGNIVGSMQQGCRDVYFVRALGICAHYQEKIQQLDDTMSQRQREGKLTYKRIDALPAIFGANETEFYTGCYSQWQDSQRTCMKTKCSNNYAGLAEVLGCALTDIMEQYKLVKPNMSETIEKNFIIKLMYWFDFVMDNILTNWNEKSVMKIAAHNVSKEQEYLFYYMLTLIGADVLLLQNKADIAFAQDLKALSIEIPLGTYGDVDIPKYEIKVQDVAFDNSTSLSSSAQANAEKGTKIKVVVPPKPGRKTSVPTPTVPSQAQPPQVHIPRRASSSTTTSGNAANNNTGSGTRQEKSFEELALLASSVVMITIHDQYGSSMGSGSGIMVGRAGYILTNNHVASGGKYYSVKIEEDDRIYKTDEVIKYNSVFDLAVIRIDRTLNPIPIYQGTKKLVRGQKVVAIGSPLGLFNSVSNGIISGFRTMGNVDMIQFTAPTSHGSSGGAVLNMYGEVIGISTAGIDDGQNINLAVGYECINMFVKGFVGA